MNLKEKVKALKVQQEQAKELFIKYQGAIEVLESMIEEDKPSNKDKKQFFEIIRGNYGEIKQGYC